MHCLLKKISFVARTHWISTKGSDRNRPYGLLKLGGDCHSHLGFAPTCEGTTQLHRGPPFLTHSLIGCAMRLFGRSVPPDVPSLDVVQARGLPLRSHPPTWLTAQQMVPVVCQNLDLHFCIPSCPHCQGQHHCTVFVISAARTEATIFVFSTPHRLPWPLPLPLPYVTH
eukprot:GGOE01025378.1.p2 GENE.GGOE01025378.1~~GGOE01025378.1.p2  ORF type:complete len:169 (-),score=4.72 GGOE01025378.1:638-1144(-)